MLLCCNSRVARIILNFVESKEIKIKNKAGKKLFCRVEGIDPQRRSPSVLVVHGFKGDSTQRHIAGISDSLASLGFLTIRVDLSKNPGKSYLNFPDVTYVQELFDLEDIFGFLLQMPEVDPTRIGIAGHSLGGMLTAELASKHRAVKSLVILSGVYDYRFLAMHLFNKPFDKVQKDFEEKDWSTVWSVHLNRELHVKKSFYEDVFLRTADKFAAKIKCPTLIVSSGSDESVAQSHADNWLKNIGSQNKKMEIINGSDHNYSGQALDKVCSLVTDWFTKTL